MHILDLALGESGGHTGLYCRFWNTILWDQSGVRKVGGIFFWYSSWNLGLFV